MLDQIINFIIPNAYAETAPAGAAAGPQGGGLSFFIIMAIILLFFYFTFWRPQSKRAKEQQNMLGSLAKGDEVMTAGGLLGRITKISDQYITLSIANNVDIIMQKSAIVSILPKGTIKSIE